MRSKVNRAGGVSGFLTGEPPTEDEGSPCADAGCEQVQRPELEEFDVEQVAEDVTEGKTQPGGDEVEDDAAGWAAEDDVEACAVGGGE